MTIKTTAELLFEKVAATEDTDLAAVANEVEYLEQATSNLLSLVMQIQQATKEILDRAHEEMKKAYSPERFEAMQEEAQARIAEAAQPDVGESIEALLRRLTGQGDVEDEGVFAAPGVESDYDDD
jgi:hypothetical protein